MDISKHVFRNVHKQYVPVQLMVEHKYNGMSTRHPAVVLGALEEFVSSLLNRKGADWERERAEMLCTELRESLAEPLKVWERECGYEKINANRLGSGAPGR